MALNPLFIFVTLAILASTADRLLWKYIIRKTEPYACALVVNAFSAVFFFFIALTNFSLPKEPLAYLVLVLAAVLWSLASLFSLISYKKTEVSVRDPLAQSKIIIAMVLGLIFLGEAVTIYRVIGTVVIFFGVSVLVFHPEKRFGRLSEPGVRWTFLTALLGALVAIVDKAALHWFNVETYGFLVFFFPGIILSLFLYRRTHHVGHLFKIRWKYVLIATILSAVTYYLMLKSYSLADVTLVYPLFQLATLLTVLGGIIFMKEREHFWQKIIAAVLVIIGTVIIGL